MKTRIIAVGLIAAFGTAMTGCSFSVGTDLNTNTKEFVASNKSAANANSAAKPSTDSSSKPKLTDESKPAGGNAKTASKANPVPDDWIYIYDENKGYGFSLPADSEGEDTSVDGVDVFVATTPSPSEIDVFVLAYKDQDKTKEDLLNDAVAFLEELGQKVTPGELKAGSDEYAVADATTIHPSRGKGKLRILVGTDITDNYVMIIGVEEARFAANESIIDAIWGSFEMWSGGGASS